MHSNSDIEHKGTIVGIDGNMIDVSITAMSACGACRVKNICGMGETEEKVASVHVKFPDMFSTGEEVLVAVSSVMGIKAVFIAYVVPLILMLASLLILSETGLSEVAVGLITLGVAALYFIVLFFLRKRLEREIVFKIQKI